MGEWFEKKTLGTLLDEAAKRWGPREALAYEGRRWSFAQLQADIDDTARAFIGLGILPGNHVALWMPNRPEWLSTFFALAKLGAVVVSPAAVAHRHQQVDPDATVLILYTSGTTGFPKGVMHSHNMQRTVIDAGSRMGMTPRDVILMYLPLFHVFGLYEGLLMCVATGARMVLTTLFNPREVWRLIAQEGATILNGFDTHFHALTTHPACAQTDRSTLRTGLFATGMASSEPAARQTQRLLCPTVTGWGMTETGCGVTRSFLDSPEEDRCLASGCALPGYACKVIDPATGATVPWGTVGELCVRGYSLMQGYYKQPEETAAVVDAEGWLHTGDVVTMRDDGTIRFLGRYRDLLEVGGENVDPTEVEGFLLRHPAIDQVQIIGVPDARLSEVPCACILPTPGEEVTHDALVAFCRGQLASFKIPQYTVIMDGFPMTSSGKVQKFKLREMATASLGLG